MCIVLLPKFAPYFFPSVVIYGSISRISKAPRDCIGKYSFSVGNADARGWTKREKEREKYVYIKRERNRESYFRGRLKNRNASSGERIARGRRDIVPDSFQSDSIYWIEGFEVDRLNLLVIDNAKCKGRTAERRLSECRLSRVPIIGTR